MIVFDLAFDNAHVFEAWFGSSEDYLAQKERGLVSCPICETRQIEKAVMAPRISAGSGESRADPIALSAGGDAAKVKAMFQAMAKAQAKALEGSEHVGDRFVAEARAIHEGESRDRPIHGRATIADAKALAADGVPVAPLPFPVRPSGTDN